MDKDALEAQLKKLPEASRVAFAARVVMRMLPMLALQEKREKNGGDIALAQTGFWFWEAEQRPVRLLNILLDQAYAAFSGAAGIEYSSRIDIGISGAYPKSIKKPRHVVFVSDAAQIAGTMAPSAVYASLLTVSAVFHVKDCFGLQIGEQFEQQCEIDFKILQTQSVAHLMALPLWQEAAPDDWLASWGLLQTQIQQLDPSFAVWLALPFTQQK